jgi:hypothetical protein
MVELVWTIELIREIRVTEKSSPITVERVAQSKSLSPVTVKLIAADKETDVP